MPEFELHREDFKEGLENHNSVKLFDLTRITMQDKKNHWRGTLGGGGIVAFVAGNFVAPGFGFAIGGLSALAFHVMQKKSVDQNSKVAFLLGQELGYAHKATQNPYVLASWTKETLEDHLRKKGKQILTADALRRIKESGMDLSKAFNIDRQKGFQMISMVYRLRLSQ